MAVPRIARPVMGFLATPRGQHVDATAIRYTGHSPYAILYGIDMEGGLRPPSSYRPPLALTTIGRRSGKRHTIGLAYYEVDAGWAVVGSAGGSAREPHWVRNVRDNPAAWVHLHRHTTSVSAEVLDGPAKEPLWAMITARAPVFATFQAAVQRDIPVVVLRRRG